MTDREALLAAIVEQPLEDVPRLMYADWLEENDPSPLAVATSEFIRIACPARKQNHDPSRMPNAAYRWLDDNWKRLVPTLIAAHVSPPVGELIQIHGHSPFTVTEANGGMPWNRNGRSLWVKIGIRSARPTQRPRILTPSVGMEFFKGFCLGFWMFSPWCFEQLESLVKADQPLATTGLM